MNTWYCVQDKNAFAWSYVASVYAVSHLGVSVRIGLILNVMFAGLTGSLNLTMIVALRATPLSPSPALVETTYTLVVVKTVPDAARDPRVAGVAPPPPRAGVGGG